MHRLPPLLILALACAAEPPEPAGAPDSAPTAAAASALQAPLVALDVGIDARVAPGPPNGDPDRILELGAPLADLPAGAPVLDARWVGGHALVLHPDHSLWVHGPEGRRHLDDRVEAPLSVREGSVAYVRGEMPFFEVVLLEHLEAEPQQLTEGYGPAWNPALGPERQIVFVSSREGRPELYRVRPGQSPERLQSRAAFPSSVRAPTFDGATLTFEDEEGAEHALRVEPAESAAPGALR